MITNKLNINNTLYKVLCEHEHEPRENGYSVTEILGPVREIILSHRHYKEISVDVADLIPALFGSAVHKMLETKDEGSEERLEYKIGDKLFIGVADLFHDDVVEDYKTTTTSKVMRKDFEEHRKQVLMYAWLRLNVKGIKTNHFKINYLMKDWSKIKACSVSNYPQSALYVFEGDISDVDYLDIENYILSKFEALNAVSGVLDDELPECSDEERWYTGTKYAVYKNQGDKRAVKVCDSEDEAKEIEGGYIEKREGQYLKCDLYCKCRKFCSKYKSY